jgi:hypothetical protein
MLLLLLRLKVINFTPVQRLLQRMRWLSAARICGLTLSVRYESMAESLDSTPSSRGHYDEIDVSMVPMDAKRRETRPICRFSSGLNRFRSRRSLHETHGREICMTGSGCLLFSDTILYEQYQIECCQTWSMQAHPLYGWRFHPQQQRTLPDTHGLSVLFKSFWSMQQNCWFTHHTNCSRHFTGLKLEV